MISEPYFKLVKSLADYEPFRTVIAASEEQIERQRHMEYASRFLVDMYVPYDGKHDVEDFIDEGMIQLAGKGVIQNTEKRFKKTFDLLHKAFGADTLRRMDEGKHQGRVSLAAFECIAVGIGKNLDYVTSQPDPVKFVRARVQKFWTKKELPKFFAPGLRGTIRIQRTIPFGEKMFAP